jgi:hypothetical protein
VGGSGGEAGIANRWVPALFALVAGCGDIGSYEDVAKANLELQEEIVGILEGITDRESAEAALPRLKALEQRKLEIDAASAKLGAPAEGDFLRASKLYQEGMREIEERRRKVIERVLSDPEIVAALRDMPNLR